jgi:plasmid maintenance system antidote protein VapI
MNDCYKGNREVNDVHIGTLIGQKLEERSMTITAFARHIHCDRTTVYHLLKQKSIDVEKMILISRVLDYDFFHEIYCKPNTYTGNEPESH